MPRVFCLVLAFAVVMSASGVLAGDEAAAYLGPKPGMKLTFNYKNGIRVERAAFSGDDKSVLIEEQSYYPPELTPTGEPMTGKSTYSLSAKGSRLTQMRDKETVILDLNKAWTEPLGGKDGASGRMDCRVDSKGRRKILGRDLNVVDVSCDYSLNGSQGRTAYTVAEGLGIVGLAVYSGDKLLNEMKLTGIEELQWRTDIKP